MNKFINFFGKPTFSLPVFSIFLLINVVLQSLGKKVKWFFYFLAFFFLHLTMVWGGKKLKWSAKTNKAVNIAFSILNFGLLCFGIDDIYSTKTGKTTFITSIRNKFENFMNKGNNNE